MAFEDDKILDNSFMAFEEEDEVEFLPIVNLSEEEDEEAEKETKNNFPEEVPILVLRNTVLFPGVVTPITVGRDKSIKAVKAAFKKKKFIGVVSQKSDKIEDPEPQDLQGIGTLAKIIKLLKMPDGSTTAIIQGRTRFNLNEIIDEEPYFKGLISPRADVLPTEFNKIDAIISSLKDLANKIINLSPNLPSEAKSIIKSINKRAFLIHFIASNIQHDIKAKQEILEVDDLEERAELVLNYIDKELQLIELKEDIQSRVRGDIEKQQRDYFLNQQLKTIQEELGGDNPDKEIKNLQERSKKKKWGKPIAELFDKELKKLRRVNPAAADYSVIMNYLELLLELPWNEFTKDNLDLKRAQQVLSKEHYGLEKIKERILEYLAVLKLKGNMKSPILCFVGPPGVGKTSLGKSIAKALKRKYVRMSLGGLHDESEIRGHRKTYIGAMPGRVVQSLKKVKSSNPVFILDEIDKVGKDFRGDPSSALLEVLDPEQNSTFYDNYLEAEYDLSKVMFIATANNLGSIQPALRDRMEIIHVSGYSIEEKVEIAKKHLIPQQREAHGITGKQVRIKPESLEKLVEKYTRESGVRELNRVLASVMRYIAKNIAMETEYNSTILPEHLKTILGSPKHDRAKYLTDQVPGVAVGLAWTQVGGDILFIEVSTSKGKGKLVLTGSLGDVMKESATTALSFIKAHADAIGIKNEIFETTDIHIHVPEGAVPKDGPSAGITMLSAITSALRGRLIKPYLAMTGEITLRGKVLPVGGIKEKILAAKRSGIQEVMMCEVNRKDVEEINPDFIKGLKFHYVSRMEEVLKTALNIQMEVETNKWIASDN